MDTEVFVKVYHETMVDTYHQLMFMLDSRGTKDRKVNLNIKDVGSRFAREGMYADQDAFIVCFNVTDPPSFAKAQEILLSLQQQKKHIVVCGLGIDQQREIPYQDGERLAEKFQAPYIECSAKDDVNVEAVFDLVLTQIFK